MTGSCSGNLSRIVSAAELTELVGTFHHWKALGLSVFLKDKAMLVPELQDKAGLIYAKNVSSFGALTPLFIDLQPGRL